MHTNTDKIAALKNRSIADDLSKQQNNSDKSLSLAGVAPKNVVQKVQHTGTNVKRTNEDQIPNHQSKEIFQPKSQDILRNDHQTESFKPLNHTKNTPSNPPPSPIQMSRWRAIGNGDYEYIDGLTKKEEKDLQSYKPKASYGQKKIGMIYDTEKMNEDDEHWFPDTTQTATTNNSAPAAASSGTTNSSATAAALGTPTSNPIQDALKQSGLTITYASPRLDAYVNGDTEIVKTIVEIIVRQGTNGTPQTMPVDGVPVKHHHITGGTAIAFHISNSTIHIAGYGTKSDSAIKGSGGYDWDTKPK